MDKTEVISDPQILFGKPVIAGTRVSVELILDKIAAGDSYDEILEDYPQLTRESILAAVRYASQSLRRDTFHEFPSRVA